MFRPRHRNGSSLIGHGMNHCNLTQERGFYCVRCFCRLKENGGHLVTLLPMPKEWISVWITAVYESLLPMPREWMSVWITAVYAKRVDVGVNYRCLCQQIGCMCEIPLPMPREWTSVWISSAYESLLPMPTYCMSVWITAAYAKRVDVCMNLSLIHISEPTRRS